MYQVNRALAFFCCLVFTGLCTSASARSPAVALVTDVEGQAMIALDGHSSSLELLQRVRVGSTITLTSGSHLTLHYGVTHTDYNFTGPAVVTVHDDIATSPDTKPVRRKLENIPLNLDMENSSLGAVITRSIGPNPGFRLVSPVDITVVAGQLLTFEWIATAEADSYQMELIDDSGQALYQVSTSGNRIMLSPGVNLATDTRYQWKVSAVSGSAISAIRNAEFRTTDEVTTTRFHEINPLASGVVSDRILYGLILEQLDLRGEADKVWRKLQPVRPALDDVRPELF